MSMLSRRAVLALPAALGLPALAQQWPARRLRLIVPYPAGGSTDLVARALGHRLAEQMGQPVLVENRAGAGGTIGMDLLAKAPADGYTLAFSGVSPLTLSPALGRVSYDPERDFTPVASVMVAPLLLLATTATAARDLPELLVRARDWPDTVRWATAGAGSLGHLVLEQVQLAARVRMVHIPYNGGFRQLADALSAEFEVVSMTPTPGLEQHIRPGRLRALAVGAPGRLEALPQVPTLAELGYPRANLAAHFGVFAPGNLPVRILDRINSEVNTAVASAELRALLRASDTVPTGGSARDFARQIAADADVTADIVRAVGSRGE